MGSPIGDIPDRYLMACMVFGTGYPGPFENGHPSKLLYLHIKELKCIDAACCQIWEGGIHPVTCRPVACHNIYCEVLQY